MCYISFTVDLSFYLQADPTERHEDDIIAYTWHDFIEERGTSDPFIVLQLPMVKVFCGRDL